MKTRIIKPKLWSNPDVSEMKPTTKLLFIYLVTNDFLGLSRYCQISDRQIMFDTGLNSAQLTESKEDIQRLGLILFHENWIYQNHDLAYVDYEGRDRVMESKESEIEAISEDVKEVFKGLVTGYKPVLNPKPKTLNSKSKTLNQKQEVDEKFLTELSQEYTSVDVKYEWDKAQDYIKASGKQYKDTRAFFRNWLRRSTEDKKGKGGGVYVD